jgi:hypothetical protein
MAVFTVPPTLQSFGEVVAQKFERPESRALPTFVSPEAGNATPKTAFRSLELAVPTRNGRACLLKADAQRPSSASIGSADWVAHDSDLVPDEATL